MSSDKLPTYIIHHSRDVLIQLLPQEGIAAELGVAEGAFSESILKYSRPRKLHLIDCWEHQDREDYLPDGNNVPEDEQQGRFETVSEMFAGQVSEGQVAIHRAFTTDAAKGFERGYFDWVYVDAMHTYDAVLADLRAFSPLVRENGFIAGHDYANHPAALAEGYGVIEAVNEFVKESGSHLLLLTEDGYPSYIIAKQPDSEETRRMRMLIEAQLKFLKVYDFLSRRFVQEVCFDINGKPFDVRPAIY